VRYVVFSSYYILLLHSSTLLIRSYTFTDWIPYINENIWVGGRDFNGRWQWDGNIRKDIVVADWEEDQPDNSRGSQDCLALFRKERNLKWDDGTCLYAAYYICERFLR